MNKQGGIQQGRGICIHNKCIRKLVFLIRNFFLGFSFVRIFASDRRSGIWNVFDDNFSTLRCLQIGETIGNLHLTVEYKPFFEKSAMVNRVVTWQKRAANLTCFAQAIPNATITWYYGTSLTPLSAEASYTFFTATGQSTLQVRVEV